MVQNFREIAKNPMNKIFYDKNFLITSFIVNTATLRPPCGQFMLSPRPQLHMARRWASMLHVERDETCTGFLFAFSTFCCHLFGHVFNVVVRYKKEVVWTKVFAALVGNFCSFSKVSVQSLYIVSSDLTLRFRQFIRSLVSHAYT